MKQNGLMYKTNFKLVLMMCPVRVSVRHLQGFVTFLCLSSKCKDSTWWSFIVVVIVNRSGGVGGG
jgi:hypothetical protein